MSCARCRCRTISLFGRFKKANPWIRRYGVFLIRIGKGGGGWTRLDEVGRGWTTVEAQGVAVGVKPNFGL